MIDMIRSFGEVTFVISFLVLLGSLAYLFAMVYVEIFRGNQPKEKSLLKLKRKSSEELRQWRKVLALKHYGGGRPTIRSIRVRVGDLAHNYSRTLNDEYRLAEEMMYDSAAHDDLESMESWARLAAVNRALLVAG